MAVNRHHHDDVGASVEAMVAVEVTFAIDSDCET